MVSVKGWTETSTMQAMELALRFEDAGAAAAGLAVAGREFELSHAGYHALNSLRIEKAYRHYVPPAQIPTLLRTHYGPEEKALLNSFR